MGKLGITLESDKFNPNINHKNKTGNTADHDITTLKRKFHKLFNENHARNNVEVDNRLKEGAKLIQQNGRPFPIHLQSAVEQKSKNWKVKGISKKQITSMKHAS